jgi:hypothetical protein
MNEILPGYFIRVIGGRFFSRCELCRHSAGDGCGSAFVPLFASGANPGDMLKRRKVFKERKEQVEIEGEGGIKAKLRKIDVHDLDDESLRLAADAREGASKAEHGREINCRYSGKVILMARAWSEMRTGGDHHDGLRRCGFGSRIETVNAVAAWLGSFPGHQYKERRQLVINTANLST